MITHAASRAIATRRAAGNRPGVSRPPAEKAAVDSLLGALRQQTAPIYASVTRDGHVVTAAALQKYH